MHGLQNIAGERNPHVTIDGTKYTLSDMTLGEYAEKERAIVALKPTPLSLLSDLPPLPEEPEFPNPPAARAAPQEKAEYRVKLAAYQKAKADYNEAVRLRAVLEDKLFKLAQRPRVASYADSDTFDQSMTGLAWRFWRGVRDNHPEIASPDHARHLIEPACKHTPGMFADIILAVEQAEGLDLLKNSDPPAATPGATNQTETSADSPGPSSTGDCPTDTAGPGTPSTA